MTKSIYEFEVLDINTGSTQKLTRFLAKGTGTVLYAEQQGRGKSQDIVHNVTNTNDGSGGSFILTYTSIVDDGGTYTKTGSLMTLTSAVTETSGTITDSALVLDITQSHNNATGDVVRISNSGTTNNILSLVSASNTIGMQIRRNATAVNSTAVLGFTSTTSAGTTNQAAIYAIRTNSPTSGSSP